MSPQYEERPVQNTPKKLTSKSLTQGNKTSTVKLFPIILICLGIFILPSSMREYLFGESGRAVNLLVWLGLFLALITSKPTIDLSKISGSFVGLFGLFFAVLFIGSPASGLQAFVVDSFAFIVPAAIFLFVKGQNENPFTKRLLPIWCFFANVSVLVIFAGGIIDLLRDQAASQFFANLYDVQSYKSMVDQGRMVSFYGHALVSASLVTVAFVSNQILMLSKKKSRFSLLLPLLYVATMALTTSKSGFITIVIAVILTNIKPGRFRALLLTLVGAALAYNYGLFDVVLTRLNEGLDSGDLTTGRNENLESLFHSGTLNFYPFSGQIFDNANDDLIAALEYPVLRFAYKYGIVFAALLTFAYFITPTFRLFKNRDYLLIVPWLALIVMHNTFSGISTLGDTLLAQSIVTLLLVTSVTNRKPAESLMGP